MATFLFCELLRAPTEFWIEDKLRQLPRNELVAFCQLVGIPHSGTKQQLIERLIDLTELQRCLRRYHGDLDREVTIEQIQALATAYLGRELIAMCKRAGVFYSLNKYGKSATLIQWSRKCWYSGRTAFAVAKKANAGKPLQRSLF